MDSFSTIDTNNLIEMDTHFYIVGKQINKTGEFSLLRLHKTRKGWKQESNASDRKFDFEYVSNEQIPDLMKWFKYDFSKYRMFNDLADAREYLKNDLGVSEEKDTMSWVR